jgi:tRNA (guanine-N7-)-methyltransferase
MPVLNAAPPPSGYWTLADLAQPIEFRSLFGREGPVEVEIGAGRGDFLIDYSRAAPELNLVGIERKLVILRRAVWKLQNAGADNVAMLNAEVRHLFENYFAAQSVQAVHAYFPDPWPKKRHAKRRLFQDDTPQLLLQVLQPGGYVHVRTDVQAYFERIIAIFSAAARFSRVDPPPHVLGCPTGYERRFMLRGQLVWRTSFVARG